MLLRFITDVRLMLIFAIINVFLCVIAVLSTGYSAVIAVVAMSFFMSLMFPTIFTIAIRGLDKDDTQVRTFSLFSHFLLTFLTTFLLCSLFSHSLSHSCFSLFLAARVQPDRHVNHRRSRAHPDYGHIGGSPFDQRCLFGTDGQLFLCVSSQAIFPLLVIHGSILTDYLCLQDAVRVFGVRRRGAGGDDIH